MSELWIVCGVVFVGVVLAVQALYRMVSSRPARPQHDQTTIGGGRRRRR